MFNDNDNDYDNLADRQFLTSPMIAETKEVFPDPTAPATPTNSPLNIISEKVSDDIEYLGRRFKMFIIVLFGWVGSQV